MSAAVCFTAVVSSEVQSMGHATSWTCQDIRLGEESNATGHLRQDSHVSEWDSNRVDLVIEYKTDASPVS
jgi:hypothetical protein